MKKIESIFNNDIFTELPCSPEEFYKQLEDGVYKNSKTYEFDELQDFFDNKSFGKNGPSKVYSFYNTISPAYNAINPGLYFYVYDDKLIPIYKLLKLSKEEFEKLLELDKDDIIESTAKLKLYVLHAIFEGKELSAMKEFAVKLISYENSKLAKNFGGFSVAYSCYNSPLSSILSQLNLYLVALNLDKKSEFFGKFPCLESRRRIELSLYIKTIPEEYFNKFMFMKISEMLCPNQEDYPIQLHMSDEDVLMNREYLREKIIFGNYYECLRIFKVVDSERLLQLLANFINSNYNKKSNELKKVLMTINRALEDLDYDQLSFSMKLNEKIRKIQLEILLDK